MIGISVLALHFVYPLTSLPKMVRSQKSALNSINETKKFDAIWQNTQKCTHETACSDKCKYCRTGHAPKQCPAYRKKCGECGKANHFKWSVDSHEDK